MNRENAENFGPRFGANSADEHWTVREGKGREEILLTARFQGRDLVVQVTGGRAHAGAVAVFPTGTDERAGNRVEDPATTTILPGHKEGPLAAECAAALGRAIGSSCVVVAGIHQDRITPQEISAIVANVRTATSRMAQMLGDMRNDGEIELPAIERTMVAWAREGAEIARRYWRNTGDLQFKSGREAVTEADRLIETMLRERIRNIYPADGIVGEEFGGDSNAAGSGRVWQIDPIDGTLNFALGLPGFCTSLALVENGEVVAACVHVPTTGDSFTTSAGQGARLNGQPIRVSGRAHLVEAIVSTQFKKDDRYVEDPPLLQALHERTYRLRRTGAIALELAWVAAGSYDALLANFRQGIQPYDVAAGLLLIREAGGMCTDHEGRPYPLGGSDLVVSNGKVHRELVDLTGRSRSSTR
jgi:myo-inositol-1(or 4)-monophosphatase